MEENVARKLDAGREEHHALIRDVLHHIKEVLSFEVTLLSRFQRSQGVVMQALGDIFHAGFQPGARFSLEDTVFRRLSRDGSPVWVADVRSDERARHLPLATHLESGSYLAVPVYLPDSRLYGLLCCLSRKSGAALHEAHIQLARVLAGIVGNHIARNEQPDQLRRFKLESVQNVLHRQPPRIVFQPVVRLSDHRIMGAEALSRFDAIPDRQPDQWFSDAWEVGLGLDLELKAMQRALEQLHGLPEPMYLAVNLSPDAFVSDRILQYLAHWKGPLDRVVLEITEHVTIPDYAPLLRAIEGARQLSLKVAIDDMGAGYAGLYHMLEIKPDILKLDISLTQGVHRDSSKQALVSSVVTFASRMGIDIIAEGIETPAEAEALKILGVAYGQGYYFARPHVPPLVVRPRASAC